MKLAHFEALRPVCPRCLNRSVEAPLALAVHESGDEASVEHGILRCTDAACHTEYPIIRGLPILLPNAPEFIAQNAASLLAVDELPPMIAAAMGEGAGGGSWFEAARQHVSTYAWDHYCASDPTLLAATSGDAVPGFAMRTIDRMVAEGGVCGSGSAIELGTGVGGALLQLAQHTSGLVLGIDMHVPMLRFARRTLQTGFAEFDLRSAGFLYRRVRQRIAIDHAARIDHWCCDATCPPFASGAFATVVGLNVLECVPSPLDLLRAMERILAPEGRFGLCTPYDWSVTVSKPEYWVGGHSPRGWFAGDPARVLEALLTPGAHAASLGGLKIEKVLDDLSWHVRTHDRGSMHYRVHLVTGSRTA